MSLNPDRPIPNANTGSALLNWLADTSMAFVHLERRFDPFFRPAFDALLRDPLADIVTALINARRPNEGLNIAEERLMPAEEAFLDSIIESFDKQMRLLWQAGKFERGGNTKTHGIVRAEFVVHDNLAPELRHGIYAEPRRYRAWVRFSGPGPYITPDIDDVGFMSMSIKLMGVPGPKLADEKFTQDMFGVSTPTFVTPDTRANAQLQKQSLKNTQIYYSLNLRESHVLDFIMRACGSRRRRVRSKRLTSAAFLIYSANVRQCNIRCGRSGRNGRGYRACRCARPMITCATRWSTLAEDAVEFDIRLQLQTDPHLMPIENNAVLWPTKLSPRRSVATLHIPKQKFDSPAQLNFDRQLSYNPWHSIPEHRPLGNQSRARRRMYATLSKLRHEMNGVSLYEPTGDEVFE